MMQSTLFTQMKEIQLLTNVLSDDVDNANNFDQELPLKKTMLICNNLAIHCFPKIIIIIRMA